MQVTIQGTVKELAEHGLRVNGKPVTQQMLSVLIRMGACEEVGEVEREEGQKGPSAKVYRFGGSKVFNFSIDNKKPAKEKEAEKPAPPPAQDQGPAEALETAVKQDAAEAIANAFQALSPKDLSNIITAISKLGQVPDSKPH